MKKIVIYGASGGGKKVYQTLQGMGEEIDFFVDSNESKWDTVFEGKKVKSPQTINKNIHNIIIASELNQEKIEEKLADLNLLDSVISKEEIMFPYFENQFSSFLQAPKRIADKKRTVFIELLEGTPPGAGGIVSWTILISKIFRKNDVASWIVASDQYPYPSGTEDLFLPFDNSYKTYWNDVIRLADVMEQHLPCTIILNKQMQMLYAAILLKAKYPTHVKIISVIHNDAICLYNRSLMIQEYVDQFLAITSPIASKASRCGIIDHKILCRDMPIKTDFFLEHIVDTEKKQIDIAYAGRLEIQQKCIDLIPRLIEELENQNVPYRFHIAGKGSYENDLKDFISKNHYENKVLLYDFIPSQKMPDFWKDKDICVVVSSKEGCCTSMMEAMAAGAVPVTTCFSAAIEYVGSTGNGIVVDFDDVHAMAVEIGLLQKDREKLRKLSQKSSSYIHEKCNENGYEKFLLQIIG